MRAKSAGFASSTYPAVQNLLNQSTTGLFQLPSLLHPRSELALRAHDISLRLESRDSRQPTSQEQAHYEIRLGEQEESTSKEFLHAVLRTNRRRLSARAHHPSLLLQLQVLPRSLQARLIRTQETCEGIMTIQDENHPVEACDRARMP